MENKEIQIDKVSDLIDDSVSHFSCSFADRSFTISGFGSDEDPGLALTKAMAELAERNLFYNSGGSYYGYAAHTDPTLAKKNSLLELLERDIFLSSWVLGLKPRWLGIGGLFQSTIEAYSRPFKDRKTRIYFGIVGVVLDSYVMVSVLELGSNRVLVDSACGDSIESCLYRLYLQQRRAYSVQFPNLGKSTLKSINEIGGPTDHYFWYLDSKNGKDLIDFYDPQDHEVVREDVFFEGFEHQTHVQRSNILPQLYVAKSYSNNCQRYYSGIARADKLNFTRLCQLRSLLPNSDRSNLLLHPLG